MPMQAVQLCDVPMEGAQQHRHTTAGPIMPAAGRRATGGGGPSHGLR